MEHELRRRTPRIATDRWPGRYLIEGDPQCALQDCCLLDISLLGVGLELFGPASQELVGRRLIVQIDVVGGHSMNLQVAGVVRNISAGRHGGTRAGIEFSGLSPEEHSVLTVMEQLNIFW